MFELLGLASAGAASVWGYFTSRSFVRKRLRFVNGIHRAAAPWGAGVLAAIVAAPVVMLLPIVGAGTAILFGTGVGVGVAAGARDLRKRIGSGG